MFYVWWIAVVSDISVSLPACELLHVPVPMHAVCRQIYTMVLCNKKKWSGASIVPLALAICEGLPQYVMMLARWCCGWLGICLSHYLFLAHFWHRCIREISAAGNGTMSTTSTQTKHTHTYTYICNVLQPMSTKSLHNVFWSMRNQRLDDRVECMSLFGAVRQ